LQHRMRCFSTCFHHISTMLCSTCAQPALHELHDQVQIPGILEGAQEISKPKAKTLGHRVSFVVCLDPTWSPNAKPISLLDCYILSDSRHQPL
jgi:hypothetical protein